MRYEKLKEAVHFICRYAPTPESLGATKLHKILWLFDSEIFRLWGQTSTDERYIKKPQGPWSTHAERVIRDLESTGRLRSEKVEFHGFEKRQFYAKGLPDESQFKPREIRELKRITERICREETATTISDKTHDHIWEIAQLDEEIPAAALLVKNLAPITDEDRAWARQVIAAKG